VIDNTKCECGHQNPVDTILCESCGKPLDPNDTLEDMTLPLEMRYDGVARRSQKANPNVLDRIWNFFSSVKVAIYLILITLIVSSLGTIYPQQSMFIGKMDFDTYYKENYGWTGSVYHFLGLSNTYDSWWFRGLLVMIGASLIICSLDRILPLYRALSKRAIRKHPTFLLRQRLRLDTQTIQGENISNFVPLLEKRNYRVYQEEGVLLAEKNRFSRWGPYINHIGLIIFLIACLLRSMFAYSLDFYAVQEGETKPIADTGYYMKNEDFNVTLHPDGKTVKAYVTKSILYKCVDNCDSPGKLPELKEVTRHDIRINEPLKYRDLSVFNVDYEVTPSVVGANVHIWDASSNAELGQFKVDLFQPQEQYKVNDYVLDVMAYYPEAELKDGEFITKSTQPKAPAFVFLIKGPNMPAEGQVYLYFIRPIDKANYNQDLINERAGSKVKLGIGNMQDVSISEYTTYFNVTRDRTMPYIWVGATISMIGLIMGFYWHHRRIWIQIEQGRLLLGAHTNKNWYGFRKEIAFVLNNSGIIGNIDDQQLVNEVKPT
jgi:cytochrome c biogenesis protein